jgi:hypothetical protein
MGRREGTGNAIIGKGKWEACLMFDLIPGRFLVVVGVYI